MIRVMVKVGGFVLLVGAAVYLFVMYRQLSRIRSYESILEQIDNGTLVADTNGEIRLSAAYGNLVANNIIYVGRTSDGRPKVLFPTWLGRGNDLDGYLYVHGGIRAGDSYPAYWASGTELYVDVGPRKMLPFKAIKYEWYYITRRLD